MADFFLVAAAGLEIVPWIDPPDAAHAGRIGEVAAAPHRRYRKSARVVEVNAILDGDSSPVPNLSLGGRRFVAFWGEAPDGGPALRSPNAATSIIRCTPTAFGHYALVVRRPSGGGCIFHFDVDPPEPAVVA